jgi:nucleoside-diphosphate-sugar epimerase
MINKPRILLTGASGTVGHEVFKQLYQKKDKFDLTVFDIACKKTIKKLSPFKKGIEIVYGDISNYGDIREVCSNKDYVIHLAAIIPPLADDNPELALSVNTKGTENLIRNLEQLSPDAFFMYSSSISVYGDRLENPQIKVGDHLMASEGDEYAKTKIAAEKIVCESKLDWTIFRLTAIMGNHSDTKLMFHMPLKTSMEIATPEDTGRAFVHAIDNKEAILKRIYNLGGGKNCRSTYEDFLSRSYDLFGLGKLDFPNKAFAEKNFHCGFYADGDDLENILLFRRDNLDDYFKIVEQSVPVGRKFITSLFKKQIKQGFLKQSEPYQAFLTKDLKMMKRYFGEDE